MTSLVYGGQTELIWARLLHHQMLYIRLTALRVLSSLGEGGARALLMGPCFRRKGESYPFVWALSRCIHPGLFSALQVSAAPAHDLLSRARFLARRAAHPHIWRYQRGRAACAEAIVNSDHPLETLACTVRMLEMHRDDAVPALLEILRLPAPQLLWDEKAECAAWALGQIGPLAVPEILQEYRNASKRVAEHLATALWYLGPTGVRALPALLNDSSHTATAALVAMEDKASLQMIAAARGPVWLDEAAVQALAEIAFSEGDRTYAAAALSCFGPAAPSGLPILRHLARDERAEVRLNVARGLGWGGRPEGMSILAELAEDPVADVAERARKSMESYYSSPTEMQATLLAKLRSGDDIERRRAAEQLARIGISEDEDISDLLEPEFLVTPLLKALNFGSRVPERYRALVLELIQFPGEVREAAAQLLSRWPDDEDSRLCWRVLLWEKSDSLRDLALAAVRRSGLSLREWGLEPEDLRSLPVHVVAGLLSALPPKLLHYSDLMPLLRRSESQARLAAAIALGACSPPLGEVEEELVRLLYDKDSNVAVECARTLLTLGSERYRWALLRSSRASDRVLALESGELPAEFRENYVDGILYTEKNSETMRMFLGIEQSVEIEVEAFLRLGLPAASTRLARLGQHALDKLPELLGHSSPGVRLIARETLKALLTPTESYAEWLALHGLLLPLEDGPSPAEVEQLQSIVCDYMVRAQLWSDQRLRPLWQIFSRSSDHHVASRAVEVLARSYLQSPDQSVLDSILLALHHPEEAVRRTALLRVGRHTSWRAWVPPFRTRVSAEAGLVIVARRFAEGDPLEPVVLQQALEHTMEWRLNDCNFFVPEEPEHLLTLFDLVGRSVWCDGAIHQLIWTYRGRTPKSLWKRLQDLSRDESLRPFHPTLAERWPRLLLFAMKSRGDWLDWVLSLGSCARAGLRDALRHRRASYRLQALEVLRHLEQGHSDYLGTLQNLSKTDPDPAVQAAARNLLNPL